MRSVLAWISVVSLLLAIAVASSQERPPAPVMEPGARSPRESLQCLKPRPGFTVELMAAEPLVMDPIAFAWGPDGKFWVVEMGDYPLGTDGKGKPGGRVKMLEKTAKASGRRQPSDDAPYDKATVFLDNLGYPTGVMAWGKGVLVTCAPDIFYAEDTDGDGKADKKIVLFIGFGEGNQQHRLNGLVWGLDNWIHGANGDSGGKVWPRSQVPLQDEALKKGAAVDIRGRDFRIKPDNGLLDASSGQTQFGRARDDWGNWFGNNNSNPMWHYALEDHYLRRNPHLPAPDPRVHISITPGAAPVYPASKPLARFNDYHTLNRFTSACSAIVYRDDLFGPEFVDNTFVSEPVHNLVHREVMKPRGITFTSRRADDEQTSEFLASTDNWFRPTMIQTGPDGALWVADMYRHVIEHPQWIPLDWQKKLDLRAGHNMGRIYRVFPTDKKPRVIPRLDKLDTPGLVAALDSPSGWQRDMAQMLLVRRKDPKSLPLLRKMAADSKNPLARLHALCTFDGLGWDPGQTLLIAALNDAHPGVRRHAVRIAEPFLVKHPDNKYPELGKHVARLADDADAQVRLQVACTLGEWDDPEAGKVLGRLAVREAGDKYFQAAVLSSVNARNFESVVTGMIAAGKGHPPGPLLVKMLRLADKRPRSQAALFEALAATADDSRRTRFEALSEVLDALEQQKMPFAKLYRGADAELKPALGKLLDTFRLARTTAADAKASVEDRSAAVTLLARGVTEDPEELVLLADLVGPQTPSPLQAAAVTALGKLSTPQVPHILLKHWKNLGPGQRAHVFDVLTTRSDGVPAVLEALQKKEIFPFDIDAARRQRLLESKDLSIKSRAAKIFAGSVDADRQRVVNRYRLALSVPGDPGQGGKVFARTCANCHQLGGVGQQVGPDLGSVADKSADGLLVAILDPNRAVEARYINYTAVTKAGRTYSGLIASETGTSMTLVGVDGKSQAILRNEIDELFSSGKSAMPEGLEKDLTLEHMVDLIAFVQRSLPVPKRKVFAGNEPQTVRPEADGSLRLKASTCAIHGKTLVFEKQYGNLGYWSSLDDHAVWTVDVPKAGSYVVWFDWACAEDAAGNAFDLVAGTERLTGKVAGTGTWDTYRFARHGEIRLAAGTQQIVMRGSGLIRGALIDLKEIKLIHSSLKNQFP